MVAAAEQAGADTIPELSDPRFLDEARLYIADRNIPPEITPEMLVAGASVLWSSLPELSYGTPGVIDLARAVWQAMARAGR